MNLGRCKKNPNGKKGCVEYSDKDTCTGCKRYNYLLNNDCYEIMEDQRIPYCLYYLSETECKGCEEGYYPNY